jgi:hypothetical protein
MITGFASAQSADAAEVELSVVNDDLTQRGTLDARVEVSDTNASNISSVFTLGDVEIADTQDREVEYEVTSEDVVEERENLTVEVFDNGSLIGSDSVELELEPVGEYNLRVRPEKIKPGEKVEAKVTYGNQTLERMEYDWDVGFMKAEGEEVGDGPEIGFKTRGDLGREEDEVRVTVRNDEGDVIGSAEESIEFEIYKPEVEGLDVEYGEGEVTVTVSEERLRERPEVRLGKALDNWTKVEFSPREMSGGSEIKLEQKNP